MQYLQGETLAARIEKGPLPSADLLRYASEIADALDKVYRQGIVHRDPKQGNVMLTKAPSCRTLVWRRAERFSKEEILPLHRQ